MYLYLATGMKKSNIFPWKVLETGNKSDSESQPSISSSKDDDEPTPKKLCKSKRKREDPSEYTCSICNFHCEQWFRFEDHVKIVHSITALFPCQISNCFKYYQSKNRLKNHCKTCHLDSLSCAKYMFVANGPMSLQSHIQEHSNQSHKKFKCASCDCGFGSKWDQNRHFKKCRKNPEREITCKRCIEVGANVDVQGGMEGLVSHLQRDHALKGQWICENCHKLYASEKRLDNHMARCNKKSKTEVSSNSEEMDVTDHD